MRRLGYPVSHLLIFMATDDCYVIRVSKRSVLTYHCATDNLDVVRAVEQAGGEACMTREDHHSFQAFS